MRLRDFFILIIGISLIGMSIAGASNYKSKKGDTIKKNINKSVRNIDRYKNNLFSMTSFIKLKLKDKNTGRLINIVLPNLLFADYLALQKGLNRDKIGRFKSTADYVKFKQNDYVNFMVDSENESIQINLPDFELFVGKKYFNSIVFDKHLTFELLEVNSENELLEKYFVFDYSKGQGYLKSKYQQYAYNSEFIALLLELGYDVVEGDPRPNISIYTYPFITQGHRTR